MSEGGSGGEVTRRSRHMIALVKAVEGVGGVSLKSVREET